MKAVVYIRTSSLKEEDSISQNLQEDACRNFIKDQGYQYCQTFFDNNVSGAKLVRNAFESMKEYICENNISKVIVYRRDRLARGVFEQAFLEKELLVNKCDVESATEHMLNEKDPSAILMREIIGAFAGYERRVITERTLHGKAMKLKKLQRSNTKPVSLDDVTIGGSRAFGTDNEKHLQIVKAIFSMRKMGWGLRMIASHLNNAGYKAPRGGKWHTSSVNYILKNRKYVGEAIIKVNGENFSIKTERYI